MKNVGETGMLEFGSEMPPQARVFISFLRLYFYFKGLDPSGSETGSRKWITRGGPLKIVPPYSDCSPAHLVSWVATK